MKPIIFSTEMVRAIIEGRKTETRRLIKPQPDFEAAWKNLGKTEVIPEISCKGSLLGLNQSNNGGGGMCVPNIRVPFHVGDRLWVRETFADTTHQLNLHPSNELAGIVYKSDGEPWKDIEGFKWKSPLFMPRAASRITLEITNVRVERLNDISEQDAIAEGIKAQCEGIWAFKNYLKPSPDNMGRHTTWWCEQPIYSFQTLWESVHGLGSWDANPWVWVVEFKRVWRQ